MTNLTRPSEEDSILPEGKYPGVITSAKVKKMTSKYDKKKTYEALAPNVHVTHNQCNHVVSGFLPISWDPQSFLVKTLHALDSLPDPGETLQPESLAGIAVNVWVKHRKSNGGLYYNIIRMEKRHTDADLSERQEADTTNSPNKPSSSGASTLFDDEDD